MPHVPTAHPDRAGEASVLRAVWALHEVSRDDQRIQRAVLAQLDTTETASAAHRHVARVLAGAPNLADDVLVALRSHPRSRVRARVYQRTEPTCITLADVTAETDQVLTAVVGHYPALSVDVRTQLVAHALTDPAGSPDTVGRLSVIDALLGHTDAAAADDPVAVHTDALLDAYLDGLQALSATEAVLGRNPHAARLVATRGSAGFVLRLQAARGHHDLLAPLLEELAAHPAPGSAAAGGPPWADPGGDYSEALLDGLDRWCRPVRVPVEIADAAAVTWVHIAGIFDHGDIRAADRTARVLACADCEPPGWVHELHPVRDPRGDLDRLLAGTGDTPVRPDRVLRSLYDQLPDQDKQAYAARMLLTPYAGDEVTGKAVAHAGPDTEDELLAALRDPDRNWVPDFEPWMGAFPRLVQALIRDPSTGALSDDEHLDTIVAHLDDNQATAVARLLCADICAHPDLWDTDHIARVLDGFEVGADDLREWPAYLLILATRHTGRTRTGCRYAELLDALVDVALDTSPTGAHRVATWNALLRVPTVTLDAASVLADQLPRPGT